MTATRNRPGAGNTRAVQNNSKITPESTDRPRFRAMVDVTTLELMPACWTGWLLRATADDALTALQPLKRGDITDARLATIARSVYFTARSGTKPEWKAVAETAYETGLVDADDHAAFSALLIDLELLTPPARNLLSAAMTPPHMARTLYQQAAAA